MAQGCAGHLRTTVLMSVPIVRTHARGRILFPGEIGLCCSAARGLGHCAFPKRMRRLCTALAVIPHAAHAHAGMWNWSSLRASRACRKPGRVAPGCRAFPRSVAVRDGRKKGEGWALGENPPLPVSAGRATPRPRAPGLSAPRPPDAMARRPERRTSADDRDEDAPRHPHQRRIVHRRQEPEARGRKPRTATSVLGSPEQHPPYIHEQRSCPHNLSPCTRATSERCGGTNPHSSFSRFSAPRRRTDHCRR